ncbi:MAG: dienelactone hydrolase family protein [Spirochaetaceae bacterium]
MSDESSRDLEISLPNVRLPGSLYLPDSAVGLVIFSHGTGSSRMSPRNRFVAQQLSDAGIGSLLFDLLTAEEDEDPDNRFDIGLMAGRLSETTDWVRAQDWASKLPVGYFGSSTGSAAAFKVITTGKPDVKAVVSRGGRPDLVLSDLKRIRVPSLLVVGGFDYQIRQYNERAMEQLNGPKDLRIVPDASHLFEEEGALAQVAAHAIDWYLRYLTE